MLTLIDKVSRQVVAVVASTDGYDLALYDTAAPPPNTLEWRWDVASESWQPRPPTPLEETEADLAASPRFQALKEATPAEVDAWLDANVTDLASARRCLAVLVKAIQVALRTR